ncbi:MAG: hypothetical protein V2J14_02455, partial [Erythrobacter sp.]|nr:hypothetical protein [Erythrobacter sp.]
MALAERSGPKARQPAALSVISSNRAELHDASWPADLSRASRFSLPVDHGSAVRHIGGTAPGLKDRATRDTLEAGAPPVVSDLVGGAAPVAEVATVSRLAAGLPGSAPGPTRSPSRSLPGGVGKGGVPFDEAGLRSASPATRNPGFRPSAGGNSRGSLERETPPGSAVSAMQAVRQAPQGVGAEAGAGDPPATLGARLAALRKSHSGSFLPGVASALSGAKSGLDADALASAAADQSNSRNPVDRVVARLNGDLAGTVEVTSSDGEVKVKLGSLLELVSSAMPQQEY